MNVCKLLFKLSKTESNDLVFREEGLCGEFSRCYVNFQFFIFLF